MQTKNVTGNWDMLANLLDKYCFKTKEQIAVQNKTVKFTKKSIRQLCLLPIILLSVVFLFLKMQNIHSHITFFFFVPRNEYTIYHGSIAQISFIEWTSLELRKVIRASSELRKCQVRWEWRMVIWNLSQLPYGNEKKQCRVFNKKQNRKLQHEMYLWPEPTMYSVL